MNIRMPLLTFLIPSLLLIPCLSPAQTVKNDTRLRSFQTAVQKAEQRIAEAEFKLEVGDSLIWTGDSRISEADKDFYRIANEVKTLNRIYQSKRKELLKLSKSESRETSLMARTDLQKLDKQHQADVRHYSNQVREMKKKAMQGEADICRGQQMQATAAKTKKSSEKALREARERYELALASWGK